MKKQVSFNYSAAIGLAMLASGGHCLADDILPPGVPAYAIKHYQAPVNVPAAPIVSSTLQSSSQDEYLPGVPAYAIQRYHPPATAPAPQPATAAAASSPQQKAPPSAPPAPAPSVGYVEMGGDLQTVTHNDNWSGEYAKGSIQSDADNVWNAELLNQREFGETGQYGAIGNTHTINGNWYTAVTVGIGSDTIFLPRYRVDAFLNRKWLPDKSLITTVGLGDYKEHGIHEDRSLFLGATYYFAQPWIVQGGVRINDSKPDSRFSTNHFLALTEGKDKEHFLTLRYGFGREAYEAIGVDTAAVNLPVQEISLTWRQWLGKDWGFNIRTEAYHNPDYNRLGMTSGVFKEF